MTTKIASTSEEIKIVQVKLVKIVKQIPKHQSSAQKRNQNRYIALLEEYFESNESSNM